MYLARRSNCFRSCPCTHCRPYKLIPRTSATGKSGSAVSLTDSAPSPNISRSDGARSKPSPRDPATLHGANGTGQGFAHARETQQFLGPPLLRAPELRDDGGKHVSTQALVVTEQRAKAPRRGTDPVPHRRRWQHSLLQVHTSIGHASSHATWTEASTFAAECNELRVATAATLAQEATCLKPPTIEVLLELADHELRQPAALFHPLPKRRPVRRDRLIQHCLFRTPPRVAVGTSGGVGTRMMGSGRFGHSRAA